MRTPAQMDQVALLTDFQVTYSMIESTHSSGNRSSAIRTDYFLGFETGFKMCENGSLLVKFKRSGKDFNIPTWVFPYLYPT